MLSSANKREEGAVAITTALILIVLILLAAFLVDLGATRADARTDQLLADSAVLAGASAEGTPSDQCRVALDYFAANVGVGALDAAERDKCDALPNDCDPDVPTPATPTESIGIGPYTVVVWFPVPNDDPAMTLEGQGITERDGTLCDRMKIVVRRDRDFTFGGAGGASSSGSSVNDAVARRRITVGDEEFATLIVLDRHECPALEVGGGSKVIVEDDVDAGHAGQITVDTDGTVGCNGANGYTMITNGTNDRICAGVDPSDTESIIAGGPCPTFDEVGARIFSPAVPGGRAASTTEIEDGRIGPAPVFDEIVTRAPADHQWNCLETYGTASPSEPWLPTESDIDGCEDGNDPYIKDMADVFGSGAAFTTMGDWEVIQGGACGNTDGLVGDPSSNLYFDCDIVDVAGSDHLQLLAEDYIVFRGDLNIAGELTVDTGDDVVMFFQNGSFTNQSGLTPIYLNRTAVYIHQGSRVLDIGMGEPGKTCIDPPGGTPPCVQYPMTWTAPDGPAYDDPDTEDVDEGECVDLAFLNVPSPECFEDMALWTNASDRHILKALMEVRGVFFTPNAGRDDNTPFDLSGGATQPMRRAQFFSYRLEVSGGSSVLMKPDPESILPTREIVATLIR